jgi:hypothetical protein
LAHGRDDLSWSSQRRRRASKSLIRSCAAFRSSGVWLIADLRERLKTCPGAYHPLANQAVVAAVA